MIGQRRPLLLVLFLVQEIDSIVWISKPTLLRLKVVRSVVLLGRDGLSHTIPKL